MTTIIKWLNNRFVLGVMLVCGVVTDAILVGRSYWLSKSDWASWVQAVGSIVAIAGSFWIGKHQADVQIRVAEQARKELLNDRHSTIKGVLDRAFQFFLNVEKAIQNPEFNTVRSLVISYIKAQTPAFQRLVGDIPLYELGTDTLVHAVLDMRTALQQLLATAEWSMREPASPADGLPLPPEMVAGFLKHQIEKARQAYSAALMTIGGTPRTEPENLY